MIYNALILLKSCFSSSETYKSSTTTRNEAILSKSGVSIRFQIPIEPTIGKVNFSIMQRNKKIYSLIKHSRYKLKIYNSKYVHSTRAIHTNRFFQILPFHFKIEINLQKRKRIYKEGCKICKLCKEYTI